MKRCYVSVLSSDDYLDGLLVLFHSFKEAKCTYDCCALLTSNISEQTRSVLTAHSIAYGLVQSVISPAGIGTDHRWSRTYSKLRVFGLEQFEKIVYLDADMLVLENIDALFDCPHMSATNAGGMLPHLSTWVDLNSGLFVAVPSASLLDDMLAKVGKIEVAASGGDQDFLHAYYRDWPQRADLHLDHKYNIFHYDLDAYNKRFGYTLTPGPKRVAVIHYASDVKPWNSSPETISELRCASDVTLAKQALRLWFETYDRMRQMASGPSQ